jgi:hypothetical protein
MVNFMDDLMVDVTVNNTIGKTGMGKKERFAQVKCLLSIH